MDSAASQTGIVPHIGTLLRSIRSGLGCFILGCIHAGFPRIAEPSGSARAFLSKKCFESAWPLHLTEDIASSDSIDFARQQSEDIAVMVGFRPVPHSLATLPKLGTLQGEVLSLDGAGSETGCTGKNQWVIGSRINVRRIAQNREVLSAASFDITPRPLDTRASVELKTSVILRDLLVQSVTA